MVFDGEETIIMKMMNVDNEHRLRKGRNVEPRVKRWSFVAVLLAMWSTSDGVLGDCRIAKKRSCQRRFHGGII